MNKMNKNKQKGINVNSEIGKLRTVLLHRPGWEVENLTPELLERLLFDDIPYLKIARQEHDEFAKKLKENDVEVLYVEKLLSEVLSSNENLKINFINDFLNESGALPAHLPTLKKYFLGLSEQEIVDNAIAGLETKKLGLEHPDKYPFALDPLPNILFQRDPFASIYNGVCLNKMVSTTRNRETLFSSYVLKNHPRFKDSVDFFYDRNYLNNIEGGDILVLNKDCLIIGATERTKIESIKVLAKNIFQKVNNSNFKVIILDIVTKKRAFMHLDTVLTNVDYDKFVVHPLIFDYLDQFNIFEINQNGMRKVEETLLECFERILQRKVTFIRCGGDSPIAAGREQWNDGTNVLAISPGKVISYSRNHVTNKLLRKTGIKVIEIPSSELSRGRGGPRCMSMPIWRDDINLASN